jgi:hypothetical protein
MAGGPGFARTSSGHQLLSSLTTCQATTEKAEKQRISYLSPCSNDFVLREIWPTESEYAISNFSLKESVARIGHE